MRLRVSTFTPTNHPAARHEKRPSSSITRAGLSLTTPDTTGLPSSTLNGAGKLTRPFFRSAAPNLHRARILRPHCLVRPRHQPRRNQPDRHLHQHRPGFAPSIPAPARHIAMSAARKETTVGHGQHASHLYHKVSGYFDRALPCPHLIVITPVSRRSNYAKNSLRSPASSGIFSPQSNVPTLRRLSPYAFRRITPS